MKIDTGIKRKIKKVYYRLYITYLSLQFVGRTTLGSKVYYKGKLYTITNGTRSGYWSISNDKEYIAEAPRPDCKLKISVTNILHPVFYMHWFYLVNWLDIWAHEGIQPWMRNCRIWPWSAK